MVPPQRGYQRPYAIIFCAMNPSADAPLSSSATQPAIEGLIGGGLLVLFNVLRELAESQALPVYLVGGPVRDWLMGWEIRDLDFVVEGDAPYLARALAQRVNGRVIVHNRFGTATVEMEGAQVDLVTARKEVYPVPGVLPVVEPSSLQDDLARRDFTINAMALPLDGDVEGLVDPLGGRQDLIDGLVRTIHPQSFKDDPTRLFRAVRYEQRLDFTLDRETLSQFSAAVEGRNCDAVTGDRLRHELGLVFRERRPEKVLGRAAELGLLSSIVAGLGQGEWVKRWAEGGRNKGKGSAEEWGPWLAALAYPLSQADGEALVRRLNMPRAWANIVRCSTGLRWLEPGLEQADLSPSALARLLAGQEKGTIEVVAKITDSPAVARNLNRFLEGESDTRPALKGDDLLEMGVPQGPTLGRMLAELRDMRLDRKINSEEEERLWVKGMVTSQEG